MKRSGPIKRRTWMRRKKATPRKSGRVRDRAYLLAVKELPCCLRQSVTWPCEGPIEADHAGRRPLGRKCSDDEAIPLCRRHHRDRTDLVGWFRGAGSGFVREWCDRRIAETQARLRRAA